MCLTLDEPLTSCAWNHWAYFVSKSMFGCVFTRIYLFFNYFNLIMLKINYFNIFIKNTKKKITGNKILIFKKKKPKKQNTKRRGYCLLSPFSASAVPTYPANHPLSFHRQCDCEWYYIYIYIYIERERERWCLCH